MSRRIFALLVLSLFIAAAGAGVLFSEDAGKETGDKAELAFFGAKEFLPAKKAIMEERYDDALDLLEAEASGDFREEALFRLGGVLIQLERHKEALTSLNMLIEEFPKGRLLHKARFLKAQALAGLKRFGEASVIYEAEIEHLISKDRKEEIAQYYLKYADALAAEDREGGPRYDKAIELYRRALELEIPGLIDEEIRFKIAACYHELKNYGEEEKVLAAFRSRHPESPSLDEVEFRIAQARLESNRFAEARKSFRDFLRDHPDSTRVPEARYGIALSYNVPQPRTDTELSLGIKALNDFVEASPDHSLAPKARYEMGLSYMVRGRLDEAIAAFKSYLVLHGDDEGDKEASAARARYNLGSCYQGQKKFPAALAAFKEFLAKHPANELWDDAQLQIVVTEFEWGLDLLGNKEYDEARNRLLDFVRDYPLDERTPRAYFALGYLEFQREDYEAAIRDWERLVSKYPNTDLASQAQYRIGLIYESKLVKLVEAIDAYEKVTYGSYQDEARARIEAMRAKTLKVLTERAFTSDETPVVEITTRNIEELSMRVYRIDLEDYFVKRGTIYSVEDLDIDLIEPEKKWTAPVEEFKKYAEVTREVELPFSEPGAYVLNVSDEERTATALVLVTDLQMIVKSGREDLLVFVENVREKEPFQGAEVIVSDGGKVLFRGETGKDGVFHKADEKLKSAGALGVLVAQGGSYASNILGLQGLTAAEGLKSKAYLFTDKPIYKPGQTVRLKGFVREVSRGRYTFTDAAEYTLTLYSPQGRAVAERKVELDPFGGIDADFDLAASAPYGGYRAELRARSGWNASRAFTVGEYVPPKVTVAADIPTDVYYQGEIVKGAFKVFFNYGEPARGKTVRYSYGTGVTLEGTVDDEGKVPFEIDTRDFGGTGEYVLVAEVLDENAVAQKLLHIADTGFSLEVGASRDVILSGEQLTVDIRARKPDGKPAAAEAELRVIYLEEKEGVRSESEVDRITGIAVDEKTGRGSAAVTLAKGGDYRLRTAARDRFGNLITAERDVFVSGEEDKVKLRIFADSAAFDAGTDVKVRIHTRTEPGLALLTCEGERVFHYEILKLEKGDNHVPVFVTPDLAPNFTFAAALMDGHKFHKAEVDLNVRSNLQVKVEPETDEVAPGGKVKVEITVTDRTGEPVEGEFALAAVDAALLARFPDESGPIHEFFFGRKRTGRLATESSCTFEYKARTETIDSALQEEQRLRELRSKDMRAAVALSAKLEEVEEELEELAVADAEMNDTIAVGGGAGGAFGGRAGGFRRARAGGRPQAAGGPSSPGPAENARKSARFFAEGKDKSAEAVLGERLKALGYAGGDSDRYKSNLGLMLDEKQAKLAFEPDSPAQFRGADFSLGEGVWLARHLEPAEPETTVRRRFLETAYWNPSIVTGPDGRAEVEVELPDNTTTWKLLARGLTKETVGGQAESEVRARKTFFVELSAPGTLVEGDETTFTARLVNTSDEELSVAMDLSLEGPVDGDASQEMTAEVPAGSSEEVTFSVKAGSPGLVKAKLEARAGAPGAERRPHADAVTSSVLVKPMGVEVYAGKGGTEKGSANVTVSLPRGKTYTHSFMEISVGPSFSDYLLHMASATYRYCCLPTYSDQASQVLVKLSVIDYLGRTGHGRSAAETARLRREVENLLSTLLLAQRDDGSFPWIRTGDAEPLATAQALKAMALSASMGFTVPEDALVKAAGWIDQHHRKLSDNEKAFFLHAYSFYKKPEFTFLNSLFRKRNELSDHGLALLALAFQKSGHKDNAATLARMLIDRAKPQGAPWDGDLRRIADERISDEPAWIEDDYMTAAHATLAVALSEPRNPLVQRGVDHLMRAGSVSRRTGPGHAAAAAALSESLASATLAESRYKLDILVNGRSVKTLAVRGPHPVTTVPVPGDVLTAGDNTVAFEFDGRGTYTWAVRMSGFTKDVTPRSWNESRVNVVRKYRMAPLVHKGREIPSGFSTVELPKGFKQWEHELEEINQGETGRVILECQSGLSDRRNRSQPLVVTDTLPAGCYVIESGIEGGFDHYELGPGTITFYVRGTWSRISYPIYAAFPGAYKAVPAVVRSADDPGLFNNSTAFSLPLRERGAEKTVAYRMTPDELYNLGLALHKDGDMDGALKHLETFLTDYTPRDNYLVDAAQKLFKVAFDGGDDVRLIRYFELLRERAPSLILTFQETARVGSAYRARGEHEQALQIFAMAAGSSFGREAQVANALEREGEAAGSLMFLADLIRTYPDLSEIQVAFFALSQALQDKAGPAGGRPGIPDMPRGRIMTAAIDLLVDFLATYPKNPVCDEAAYSLISALLDLEQSDEVVRLSPIFRKRWPTSEYRSSMEYAEAYALFEVGKLEEATALLKKVADLDPDKLDPAGRDNRDLAVYILGQIDHAAGRIAAAIERYRQVIKKFADAAEAVDFFTRKSVALPEISAFRKGEDVAVELKYRNVPKVTLSVYKVDLMKLCLLRKNLNNVTDINLAGIAPTIVEEVELGEGKDYKEMKKKLDLELEEKGAYMLVVQGEGAGCTGMALIADLDLEVQEDSGSGRVRVNVKDKETGEFLKNVYVKVIGSRQSVFQSGYTDLRGIYVADGVEGSSTVIAEREGEYAFHRGQVALGEAPQRQERGKEQQEMYFKGRDRALQNVFDQNRQMQQKGVQTLQQIYQEDIQGVQIK